MTTEENPTSLHQPYHVALCEGVERDFLSSKQSWRQFNLFCQSWGTVPNNGKLNWTAQRQCFDKRKSILTWRGTKTWSMQAPLPEQDCFIALRSMLAPATATNVRNSTVLSWRLNRFAFTDRSLEYCWRQVTVNLRQIYSNKIMT